MAEDTAEDRVPTVTERQVLEALRQGQRLAEGSSKYAVAFLDEKEEVDKNVIEAMVEAGWIYQFDDLDGKAVWGLTQDGLGMLGELRDSGLR